MFTQAELEAYLDEALPPERMAAVEEALRDHPALGERLQEVNAGRDAGLHLLGAIWRRRRLTCPTREQLGSYLLGALPDDQANYITFHTQTLGCRPCAASLEDLRARAQAMATDDASDERRRRYFQSSVGRLGAHGD